MIKNNFFECCCCGKKGSNHYIINNKDNCFCDECLKKALTRYKANYVVEKACERARKEGIE